MSKLRQTERAARSRRRDMLLGAASLMLHIAVFLLLPSLAVHAELPRVLLIELVRPVAPAGAPTTAPATTPEPAPEVLTDAADAADAPTQAEVAPVPTPAPPEPTPQPAPQPESQTVPAQTTTQPVTPVAEANEATSISRRAPVVAPQSPVAVEEPVEQAPAPVADEPVEAAPQPAAEAPVEEAPSPSSPSETDISDDAPEASAGDDDTSDATDTADDDANATQDDDASQAPAAEPGPPAPPPGPSEYELRLLGEYGDVARLRIRSQARNPEQGGNGIVTFEFEVARDGHLVDVWVIKSSGYANMDNDALEAARAAFNERAEKKPFPSDVTVAGWVFVMSLKYPLY